MGRYARAVYGAGKYGIDLRSNISVEPMLATLEIDNFVLEPSHSSSFTDAMGRALYNRVQISWMAPTGHSRFVLLRSNLGYPTGPTDPFAAVLVDGTSPKALNARPLDGDPAERQRLAYIDSNVEQGREYYYAAWVMTGDPENNTDEWNLAGRAMTTTSTDHKVLETLKASLPAYMTNKSIEATAVLEDEDGENTISRWLQASAWEMDKTLTKVDLLRKVWDPQYTPAILLDDAVAMFGLPVEPALGARAHRSLLANAADITGERGSYNSISLLVESLAGISCSLSVGLNLIASTDESSFEGIMTSGPASDAITGGTGRWFFTNAALTRVLGDPSNSGSFVARDPNADEYLTPSTRFGVRLDSVDAGADISMSLGEKVRATSFTSVSNYGTVTTAWQHGLEEGDEVKLCVDGASEHAVKVVWVIDQFKVRVEVPAALADKNMPEISGWFSGGTIPTYQGIPVTPGVEYALVGKFQAANASNFALTVNYWDRNGNKLGSQSATPSATIPAAPQWTHVSAAATAPAGTTTATLSITATQTGSAQYLGVDSLMLRVGDPTGAGGAVDYTFEDAQLLTVQLDPTTTPTGGPVPYTIQGDISAILVARLTDILTQHLPIGTAFRITGLPNL